MDIHRPAKDTNQNRHLKIGKIGEEIAKRFLEKQGYKIIEQNYKTKYAEIDLVARNKENLIFVEVRTKVGDKFGTPEETINKKKIKKLWGNAMAYSAFKRWKGPLRIDAVCIILKPDYNVERLNHYENIIS
ncbi:MAG: YraN family protein [Candidatus Staskawiczbacteria bacterium]|nr:YraN family protein [Candidatus Staskawiczbacteria bacterium]